MTAGVVWLLAASVACCWLAWAGKRQERRTLKTFERVLRKLGE